ncbi:MAG: trehalose-phosphatase [Comamonas sp.]
MNKAVSPHEIGSSASDRDPETVDGAPPQDGQPSDVPLLTHRHALWLDFDGTLVDIAETPEGVQVAPGIVPVLTALHSRLGGALGVITGRPVAQIDQLLAPLRLDVAGEHGAVLRWADGRTESPAPPDLHDAIRELQAFVEAHPGLLLERKGHGLTLHYRGAPQWAQACLELVQRLSRPAVPAAGLAASPDAAKDEGALVVLHGKSVVELKLAQVDKGRALHRLMRSPGFAQRVPVFIGDDTTDEAAIAAAQVLGGIGIKVGPGASVARHRLASPVEVLRYLQASEVVLARDAAEPGERLG